MVFYLLVRSPPAQALHGRGALQQAHVQKEILFS